MQGNCRAKSHEPARTHGCLGCALREGEVAGVAGRRALGQRHGQDTLQPSAYQLKIKRLGDGSKACLATLA